MIFLSHNSKDKPIVEPLALRLRETFGQENVFYDSWAIQPGDGIIAKMNTGLEKCRIFFLFVSNNSLSSKMVTMEWQNAVMKSAQEGVKIIPIRLDSSIMPTLLLQTLYIDLFSNGLEVALKQMVDVIQGANNFRPLNNQFSNLKAIYNFSGNDFELSIVAEHYIEPKSHYLVLLGNTKEQAEVTMKQDGMSHTGFSPNVVLDSGVEGNGWYIGVSEATVPGFPFGISGRSKNGAKLNFLTVLHEVSQNQWVSIPTLFR